jgi:hypothetical protein
MLAGNIKIQNVTVSMIFFVVVVVVVVVPVFLRGSLKNIP